MPTNIPVMGRQVKFGDGASKRCDFCKSAVKFGYAIHEGPCQGFFCGPRHYNQAREVMGEIKKDLNI